jgi:hypothetical protein
MVVIQELPDLSQVKSINFNERAEENTRKVLWGFHKAAQQKWKGKLTKEDLVQELCVGFTNVRRHYIKDIEKMLANGYTAPQCNTQTHSINITNSQAYAGCLDNILAWWCR